MSEIEGSWFDPAVREAVDDAARDRGVPEPFNPVNTPDTDTEEGE